MSANDTTKGRGGKGPGRTRRRRNPNSSDTPQTSTPITSDATIVPPASDAGLDEWQALMVEWLNSPPERSRPSVVLPKPPYTDRTIEDRWRFMERAKPKIGKSALKSIIRGDTDIFRDCLVARDTGMVYVPVNNGLFTAYSGNRGLTDTIDVPIGVDEPSWWPGEDRPGGGSGHEAGEDDSDIVYMPITYEEFIELIKLLFDLPFLKQSDEDKLLVHTIKIRGLKKTGPMSRWDKVATAKERLKRFRATVQSRPQDFPGLDPETNPTVEEFPFHKIDLRFARVEEKWNPDSKAVIFNEMDTSGSMGGEPLACAKFFFFLMLIWLKTKYNTVTIVWIAHNHRAERVRGPEDFFRIMESGGTAFAPAHELVWQIAQSEFAGNAWNKYCFHATDGFGEWADAITPWIEKLIRGGFNLFGYLETDPWGWGGNWTTSGMQACLNVASDVKAHVGYARVSTLDDIPKAMETIIAKEKTPNTEA